MQRPPAAAGRFYPSQPGALTAEIARHIKQAGSRAQALGIISPHAGFMYSGGVAAAVYARIDIPERVLLLGPNHTGRGKPVSLSLRAWSMPFGAVAIDEPLARALLAASPLIAEDDAAHAQEHSLETQLPFLQYFQKSPRLRIVPLCLKRLSLETCAELSRAIVTAIKAVNEPVLIVASSDMSHYEPHAEASRKDRLAIEPILRLDPRGLYATVEQNQITMCGVHPATVMLMACNELGAQRAELARYMTSGETSGEMDRVVGYAGVIVS